MDDTTRAQLDRIDQRITRFRVQRDAADDAGHDGEYVVIEDEIDRLLELRLIVSRGGLLAGAVRLELEALL